MSQECPKSVKCKASTSKRLVGAALLFLVVILAWFGVDDDGLQHQSPKPDSISQLSAFSTRSSWQDERVDRMRRRKELMAVADAAFEKFRASPVDLPTERDKAEVELLRALAAWAAVDLNGVWHWIERHDAELPASRRWMGDVLVDLAKTEPRKALEFGLSLNEANPDTYSVPPRSLLGIAMQHLTAEDAIRVMETPNRSDRFWRVISESSSSEAYHPDFDFKALGDYIVQKEHEGERHSWKPTTFPADFVSSWTVRDPAGAEAFARAMNDRPAGAITGMEYMDFFSQLAKHWDHADVVEGISRLLNDSTVNIAEGYFAANWIQDDTSRSILFEVAGRLPDETRDRMGSDALLMNALSDNAETPDICEAAMRLFATDAARNRTIEVCIRAHPQTEQMLRALQVKVEAQ